MIDPSAAAPTYAVPAEQLFALLYWCASVASFLAGLYFGSVLERFRGSRRFLRRSGANQYGEIGR